MDLDLGWLLKRHSHPGTHPTDGVPLPLPHTAHRGGAGGGSAAPGGGGGGGSAFSGSNDGMSVASSGDVLRGPASSGAGSRMSHSTAATSLHMAPR